MKDQILWIWFWVIIQWSRDSSVDIATSYRLDGRGSIHNWGERIISAPQRQDRLWGPPSLPLNGYRVKWLRHEDDRSPLSNAEVKNGGAIPPFPHVSLACHLADQAAGQLYLCHSVAPVPSPLPQLGQQFCLACTFPCACAGQPPLLYPRLRGDKVEPCRQ
jgi:hypothetical protein